LSYYYKFKEGIMKKLFVIFASFMILFNAVSVDKIKVGAIFSVTGSSAPLGDPEKKTAIMMVDKFNKAHPDKQVELIIYDDEGDSTKAQNFAVKLIEEDGCLTVIGPTISGSSLKVLETATENKTPLISCAAAAAIVEPAADRKWIFKTAQSDKLAAGRLFKFISSKKMKKIAIITVSNGFGQSGKTFLENLAPTYGLTIVENQVFGDKDTDIKAQLTKIKSANPDAIICWGTNPGPAYVARNAKELGIKIPLFQSHGVGNIQYIELAGVDAVEGTYLVAGKLLVYETMAKTEKQKDLLTNYAKDYKTLYKEEPSTFGGHSFDAISLVLKAIEDGKVKGNTVADKNALRDFVESTKNFIGISGIFNFSTTDHNGLSEDAFSIIQIKKGKWVFVE
jgi:branched-chain amino acid transport system substrate-binding protein